MLPARVGGASGMYEVCGITLNGEPLPPMNVAILPQEPVFFENKTIKENVVLGTDVPDTKVVAALTRLNLFLDLDAKPANLSGGQKQRLALARVMLSDASIIVLDEPTSALDAENTKVIMKGILEFCKEKTVILITHGKVARGFQTVVLK